MYKLSNVHTVLLWLSIVHLQSPEADSPPATPDEENVTNGDTVWPESLKDNGKSCYVFFVVRSLPVWKGDLNEVKIIISVWIFV